MKHFNRINTVFFLALCALFMCAVNTAKAAPCTAHDRWTGDDKVAHFGIGMAIATGVTLQTRSELTGFLAGTGVGVLKELADRRGRGHCSLQDAVVTALGAAAGAKLGGWVIHRSGGVTTVAYRWEIH